MRKIALLVLLLFALTSVFSQERVEAKEELITIIPLGMGKGQVSYSVDEEGFYGPGAPNIDDHGAIWFFSVTNKFILKIDKNVIQTLDYPENYPKEYLVGPNGWPFIDQQGCFGFTDYPSDLVTQLKKKVSLQKIDPHGNKIYHIPSGYAIQFSDYLNHGEVVSIEYKPNTFSMITSLKREYLPRTNEETRAWLPTQPGGFSIGDDGLLYRNGMLWSAVKPANTKLEYAYIARLASGHCLWRGGGRNNSPSEFIVTNSKGEIEITLSLPWRKEIEDNWYEYNYGVGPWGEIYFLLPPSFIPVSKGKSGDGITYDVFGPDPSKPAELVVVRNYLKYFGRLNDSNVRLRSEPSTKGEILGTYPNKTGFHILERTGKEETIAGQKSDWVKVRLLDGTEGWFFGSFVHNLYEGPNGNPPPWPNVADW